MSLVSVAIGAAILYQLTIYLYNTLFHPFKRIPGRLLWRVSRIPHEFALIRGTIHHDIRDMHEKYGDTVRVSPNGLSFIHPDAWNDIMVRDYSAQRDTVIPVKDMLRFSDSLHVNGATEMLTADSKTHARQRRTLGNAFSERYLRAQSQPLIQSHVATLVEQMKRRVGEKLDLTKWFSLYNFEVVSDFSLGKPLGCLSEGEYHPWTRLLFESVVTMTVFGGIKQFPWIQSILELLLSRYMARLIHQHQQFVVDRVNARTEAKDERRGDLFDELLKHGGTEKDMSRDEIMANCNLMIAAGSDTTGAALTSCVFSIVSDREVYDRLAQDIRSSFDKESDITIESTARMEYLDACISESMRIYPPNPNANPRRGSPKGSLVQGVWIDSRSTLGIYHWAANHCSRNFSNPEKFDPERWLGSTLYADDRRGIAKPFSIGSSNCIGQPLALILIRLAICRLLFHFDLEILPESKTWLDQKAYWVWKKKPLWAVLSLR